MNTRIAPILVVEDNEDDVYFMRRALRGAGAVHDVRFVSDGRAALDYLFGRAKFMDRQAHPLPIVTFLDLKLPFFNGLEVLAALRHDPVLRALRVFILTSSFEERDREQARALGVEDYLVKPPTAGMLAPIIRSLNGWCEPAGGRD